MKVYVITAGEYSEYHICAVTTDKDAAKRLCLEYSRKHRPAQIEEYEADQHPEFVGKYHCFFISFSKQLEFMGCDEYLDTEMPDDHVIHGYYYYTTVMADDRENAIKTAGDRVKKYLAQLEGL